MDALEQNIAKVIADVQSAAPATDIVVTGYTVPSGALAWTTGCEAVHSLRALNSAMKAAAAARNVTYVNISSLLGGTHTNWSNSSWMQDPIHLNKHGYCKLWTHPGPWQICVAVFCWLLIAFGNYMPCTTRARDMYAKGHVIDTRDAEY